MQQQDCIQYIGRPVIDFSAWFDNKEQSNVRLIISTTQIVETAEVGNADQPEPKKRRINEEVRVNTGSFSGSVLTYRFSLIEGEQYFHKSHTPVVIFC